MRALPNAVVEGKEVTGRTSATTTSVVADPLLRQNLRLLLLPAVFGLSVTVLGIRLSGAELYLLALASVLPILLRYIKDPEPFIALFVIYLPLSKAYVIPIAPGINGTNLFELGLLLALVLAKVREEKQPSANRSFTKLMWWWAALSLFSFLTTLERVGLSEFVGGYGTRLKGWLDQFIVFFVVMALIRNKPMARRIVIYLMLGSILVLLMGFQEWTEKRFLGSIEKARLLGPQIQSNDFGGYLVYSSAPFVGLFVANWTKWRTWLMLPYFLLMARILLATFSRGAYVGFGMVVAAATYCRSKVLLVLAATIGLGVVVIEPSFVPESMKARVEQTTVEPEDEEGNLDKSSETRLILWKAAIVMTLEKPFIGHGFGSFALLKSKYTEQYVRESDNHNMFLYICSQMGLPALLVFLLLLWKIYRHGRSLFRSAIHPFDKVVGLGAAGLVGGVVGVNMFGSRMVDIVVSGYFWLYLAALAVLTMPEIQNETQTQSH
jgi:hypothetical protein